MTGPNPTDRGKLGTKRHVLTDGQGIPLSVVITAANTHDMYTRRWVVERTNSWHNRFRKLLVRYEKKLENYFALVCLGCCILIYRRIILG